MAKTINLKEIGNDPISGVEIVKEPLNYNFEALKIATNSVDDDLIAHKVSSSAHGSDDISDDTTISSGSMSTALTTLLSIINNHMAGVSNKHDTDVILDVSDYSQTDLTSALNYIKSLYDAHVAGTLNKHRTDAILDDSDYNQLDLTSVLNDIKSIYDSHVAGTADNHGSDDINNDSTVGDGNTGDISGVFENLQAQINAIVAGGIELDPRLSQALIDVENIDWTVAGFKALQDSW